MGLSAMAIMMFLPKKIFDKLLDGISRREISIATGIIIGSGYAVGFFYKFSEAYFFHLLLVGFGYLWFSFKNRVFAILLANLAVQVIMSGKQNIFPISFLFLSLSKLIAAVFFGTIVIVYLQQKIRNCNTPPDK